MVQIGEVSNEGKQAMVGVSRVIIQETVEDLKALMHQQQQVGDKERI
jgi:hypothetical protein